MRVCVYVFFLHVHLCSTPLNSCKRSVLPTPSHHCADALKLAGYDYLVLPPKVMAALASTTTLAGVHTWQLISLVMHTWQLMRSA